VLHTAHELLQQLALFRCHLWEWGGELQVGDDVVDNEASIFVQFSKSNLYATRLIFCGARQTF
jgi:hypothetical protein